MDLIWVIIFGIVGIFAAALSKQLTDEIKAWTPWIIELLIHAAVAKLPESERDRLHEEWHSDIRDTPGELGKLVVAVGFVLAALKISHDIGNDFRTNLFAEKTKRVLDMGIGVAAFVFGQFSTDILCKRFHLLHNTHHKYVFVPETYFWESFLNKLKLY